MKFVPHGKGKERQTGTYQTVTDYIIQLVQKSFRNGKDVADSLGKDRHDKAHADKEDITRYRNR
jgi:hypothetical protein